MRFYKITTMRGFAESSAKKFRVNGDIITRKAIERMPYELIAKMVKQGKVESVQVI